MPKVGIIVDGAGDFALLKTRFNAPSYFLLKTDGPRGHEATEDQIATAAKKQIGILRAAKCSKVIVLVDKESRRKTYDVFLHDLRAAFQQINFQVNVVACSADLMIENWYLSDICHLSACKAYIRRVKTQKRYDGLHGKNEIKKLITNGVKYLETKHGPDLFSDIDFSTARQYSPSFADFLWNTEN